jgi:hypothetical protein
VRRAEAALIRYSTAVSPRTTHTAPCTDAWAFNPRQTAVCRIRGDGQHDRGAGSEQHEGLSPPSAPLHSCRYAGGMHALSPGSGALLTHMGWLSHACSGHRIGGEEGYWGAAEDFEGPQAAARKREGRAQRLVRPRQQLIDGGHVSMPPAGAYTREGWKGSVRVWSRDCLIMAHARAGLAFRRSRGGLRAGEGMAEGAGQPLQACQVSLRRALRDTRPPASVHWDL